MYRVIVDEITCLQLALIKFTMRLLMCFVNPIVELWIEEQLSYEGIL